MEKKIILGTGFNNPMEESIQVIEKDTGAGFFAG